MLIEHRRFAGKCIKIRSLGHRPFVVERQNIPAQCVHQNQYGPHLSLLSGATRLSNGKERRTALRQGSFSAHPAYAKIETPV